MSFTIVLPVYGHSPWLGEAIKGVVAQDSDEWHLIIADDGIDQIGHNWLLQKLGELKDQRIEWIQRPSNLGLFANLNQAIKESKTDWVLLLCSDDKLHKDAISALQSLQKIYPQAELILSSFNSINADGSLRPTDSSRHHNQLRLETGLIEPEQMLPELLRLGSLNGNLTGMAFSKNHWAKTGPFREDWRHAADWEWLIRASESKALLLNRTPIASVRTHAHQLSVRNRESGHECQEVAAVVSSLLKHPLIQSKPSRRQWAGHVMQFQLWNLLKTLGQWDWSQWTDSILAIHNSAGLRQTCWSLLRWIPARWERRTKSSAP